MSRFCLACHELHDSDFLQCEDCRNGRRNTMEASTKAQSMVVRDSRFDSQWEADYHAYLEMLEAAGEIRGFRWKDFRLRLVQQDGERDRYYSPEALVWSKDGGIEVHEVKGYKRDAALLRFDMARSQWPMFRFLMVAKQDGGWTTIRGDTEMAA